ncbi:MAG: ABC transporter permease [Deltaproteobacteria bacterium]|nr:ABC transporter permease [Deltaproteobacteria bacterium]MBW2016170.1 ABC transporter permease [Deltaproteobacteria bacterium]MBW2129471.1 ABC transporter permease [Deltaproteobacteria bacterium]
MVAVVFGATLLLFGLLMTFSPERRAAVYINSPQQAKDLPKIVKLYGLDDPFYKQYVRWLKKVAVGDFGYSTTAADMFWPAFWRYLPISLELNIYVIPIVIMLGIWLGTVSGIHNDTWIDHATRFGAITFWSLPTFLFALILLMLFYGYFHWFPPGVLSDELRNFIIDNPGKFIRYTKMYTIDGILNGRLDITLDALNHLILPVITSVLVLVAMVVRVMRSTMIEEITKEYVITALAKGADYRTVYYKHARKNAMIPVVTISGLIVAFLLQGNIEVEVIFNRQGLGWWIANSAIQLDLPALMGMIILIAVFFVIINLVVDIICAKIDPRIRLD